MISIGCTSSGELTEKGYDNGTISVIGFPADAFHMASHCFLDVGHFHPTENIADKLSSVAL